LCLFGGASLKAVLKMSEEDSQQENGDVSSKDSGRQFRLRLCVLNEILNTERDYVRNLAFLQTVSTGFNANSFECCSLSTHVPAYMLQSRGYCYSLVYWLINWR